MKTLHFQFRVIYPTEWPADLIEEAKAAVDVESLMERIAAAAPGATVVLDGIEIAGPSEGAGMSNGYTS